MRKLDVSALLGKTINNIQSFSNEIIFECTDGSAYKMWHDQDCCESVLVEDICGNLNDLLYSPINLAEKVTSNEHPEGITKKFEKSFTWTFYKLATARGYVTIRWYGESNGYYSEEVDFALI